MKVKLLYIFTILFISAFPFANTFFKVFRGVSVSFFHLFERTASFTVTLPPLFQKYIHFHLTDFWIVGLLSAALLMKEVKVKELFFNRHSRYLTLFILAAFVSIFFSLFSTYLTQYAALINLTIASITFHLIYLLLSKRSEWIATALWLFIGVAALECLIGTGQFIFQKSLGLSFLSEPQVSPSMNNIAVYPLTETNRHFFDKLPWIQPNLSVVLRSHGTFDHPNIFGGYLVIALFISYYLFTQTTSRMKKGCLFALIPFLILTLALTFSRGPFFAWVLGSLLFFSVGIFKKEKGVGQLAGLIGGAALITIFLLFQQFIARGGFVNYTSLPSASDGDRIFYYKLASTLFAHHPFLGIGYNGFALFPYGSLDPSFAGANPMGALAHNIYLQVASETGLVGLSLMALFIFSLIIPPFKQRFSSLSLTLMTILFSLLLMGCVDHFLWTYNSGRTMLFIFCALLAAHVKVRECPSLSHSK
ncbi:MAG: O-antigen ligase family protein [Chlamydiia bacterium]|nr:O-antigen ligase family protein [Chlamydiia bacterium]